MPRKSGIFTYPVKRNWCLFLCCLFFLLSFPHRLAPRQVDLRFRSFGVKQGLSTEFVRDLFFDRQGFLWIATDHGLNRFDGYAFRHFQHHPDDQNSLGGNAVFVMHDDRSGRMWARTEGGIDILDPLTGQTKHLGQTEAKWGTSVCAMEETRDGEMWLGTMQGKIHVLDSTSGRTLPLPEPLQIDIASGFPIAQIFEDDHGDIWISCWEGGLLQYTPASGRLSRFPERASLVCPDKKGKIWFADSTNLGCLDLKRRTSRLFPLPNQPYTPVDWIFLLLDPNGVIWFGNNLGLALFDSKSMKYIDSVRYQGESTDTIHKYIAGLCLDAAGNVWMGTWGTGICQFNLRINRFQFYGNEVNPQPELSFPWVNCLLEDRDGIVWIGTRYDGLSRFDPATSTFNRIDGLHEFSRPGADNARSVFSLFEDRHGSLWIGAAGGLYLLDRQSRKLNLFNLPPVHHPSYEFTEKLNAFWPRIISSIVEDGKNTFWISAHDEGVYHFDKQFHDSTLYKIDEIIPPGLFPRGLNGMFLDRSQTLWICTTNGLQHIQPTSNHFRHYQPDLKKPDAIRGKNIFCVLEDRSGNFWIGTDRGLNLMDRRHGTFRLFSENEGMAGNAISCLAEDDNGFIWAGTSLGLSRFDPRNETFRNFDACDGVTIGETASLIRCRDGRLLAGGHKGIIFFDPLEVVKNNAHVPPVVFTTLHIGNRAVPLQEVFSQPDQSKKPGRMVLHPGDKVLTVEFSALDFSAPEKNCYAFRMEDQGGGWNDLGTQHQVTFSNLSTGKHTLRVKGSNNDGIWNETGVALQIVVLPAFWQTWWFKVLVLLILAIIALAIHSLCRTITSLKRIASPPDLDEIFAKHNISPREQEILHLVIQGKSNREMEDALFISLPTVKRHLANIYEKIGVSSRLQLINFLQGRKPRY